MVSVVIFVLPCVHVGCMEREYVTRRTLKVAVV